MSGCTYEGTVSSSGSGSGRLMKMEVAKRNKFIETIFPLAEYVSFHWEEKLLLNDSSRFHSQCIVHVVL